mmetsp:Transcript_81794/g.227761  ORF Transcript_81794/g.227761 Transcript_81794/m.227761 type:complete len:269 (-) Transcript_81794:459-1265(-)
MHSTGPICDGLNDFVPAHDGRLGDCRWRHHRRHYAGAVSAPWFARAATRACERQRRCQFVLWQLGGEAQWVHACPAVWHGHPRVLLHLCALAGVLVDAQFSSGVVQRPSFERCGEPHLCVRPRCLRASVALGAHPTLAAALHAGARHDELPSHNTSAPGTIRACFPGADAHEEFAHPTSDVRWNLVEKQVLQQGRLVGGHLDHVRRGVLRVGLCAGHRTFWGREQHEHDVFWRGHDVGVRHHRSFHLQLRRLGVPANQHGAWPDVAGR